MGFDQQNSSREDFCPFPLQAVKKRNFIFIPYKINTNNDVWQLLELRFRDDPQIDSEKGIKLNSTDSMGLKYQIISPSLEQFRR
jgi:hypothetical protein